jgi:hypothetical protein
MPTAPSPMNMPWLDLMQKPAKSPRVGPSIAQQIETDERLLFIHFVGTVQTRSPVSQGPQVGLPQGPQVGPQVGPIIVCNRTQPCTSKCHAGVCFRKIETMKLDVH